MPTATRKPNRQKQRAVAAQMPEQVMEGAEMRPGKMAALIEAFGWQLSMNVSEMMQRCQLSHQELDVLIRHLQSQGKLERVTGFPVRYCYKP